MDTELLSEEKYEELLRSRTKELTRSQENQLRQIDRAEFLLNEYREELSEEDREQTLIILKRRQMEILTNEVDKPWKEFLNSVPDKAKGVIDIF